MATNNTTTIDTTLGCFTMMGRCEETDDSSYTRLRDGKEETVSKIQLSLVVPGMQDRVRVELPLELAPATDLLAQWELEESWLLVSATSMRALSFRRTNPRPGEKELSAFVVFAATNVREASAEERKQLQAARKAQDEKWAQRLRVRQWVQLQAERQRTGKPLPLVPDLSRGIGARLDALARTRKREQLLEMALGVFGAAGVVRLQLHREADVARVSDLLVYSLEELEAVAEHKGGIRRLLEEKWTMVYKANAPRGLFRRSDLRRAT